ncbi:hypothetical protein SAMN04489732_102297 [Amycolatopsis saalfeldensis]|uniref:Uncharacterized protein n=1 Tax=Amycolatopsis saalfeldensis TaxID=394193 RepID=A0A1H8SVK8_9PSEU|nr:hypothetical protein SAMN04489732_102297 [Amycolatopsis saalfeldensis]
MAAAQSVYSSRACGSSPRNAGIGAAVVKVAHFVPLSSGIDSPRFVGTALYSAPISYDDFSRAFARRAA